MQNPFQLEFKPLISTRNSRYFRLGGVFLDSDRGTSKWFETVSTDYDPLYENLQRQKGPRRDRQKTSALYFLLWLFQVLNPSQWQSLHSRTIKTNTLLSMDPICVQRGATWHIMGDPLLRSALQERHWPKMGSWIFWQPYTLPNIFHSKWSCLKSILQTSGV